MYSNSSINIQSGKWPHLHDPRFNEQFSDSISGGSVGLEVDLQEAQRFLEWLDPEAESFTFQTFDDKKEKRSNLVRQLHSDFNSVADKLVELNSAGAGIYVAVQRTDLKGRKTENIVGLRALYGDFDQGLPQEFPLEPSIVIQSSSGKYQCYWLCHELNRQDFKCLMECLVEDFGADKGVVTVTRLLS
jgi:hypothetical protein